MPIPSMLLQPLIENSIRHGFEQGRRRNDDHARATQRRQAFVEVEDDGVGIPESGTLDNSQQRIGVRNVKERLKVLYRQDYRMMIDSQPGRGTASRSRYPERRSVSRRSLKASNDHSHLQRPFKERGRIERNGFRGLPGPRAQIYDLVAGVYPLSTFFFHEKAHKVALSLAGIRTAPGAEVATGSGECSGRIARINSAG